MASKDQIKTLITTALANEYWQLAMYCAAVAIGTGCRGGEIRNLQLKDMDLEEGKVRIVREIAKNRKEREPRLMALAEWGLRNLLIRAHALGATEPQRSIINCAFDGLTGLIRSAEKWTRTGHPIIRGGFLEGAKPDLLVHVPGNMDGNLAVIEIKAIREQPGQREPGAMIRDFHKLSAFRGIGYSSAFLIAFGDDIERVRAYGRDSRIDLRLVELWHHPRPHRPANMVPW